tara:strand:+ start:112 stop:315 length:204 start_codon:yes stop_codon:yes gene_type:complete
LVVIETLTGNFVFFIKIIAQIPKKSLIRMFLIAPFILPIVFFFIKFRSEIFILWGISGFYNKKRQNI